MTKSSWRMSVAVAAIAGQLAVTAAPAWAFCGFYVAQADANLFNKASKVVLAWDDGSMAVTMASDYQGDPKEFAVVIPVPTFIERKQIGIVETKVIDHLDRYTAPRLVEYRDEDPCAPQVRMMMSATAGMPRPAAAMGEVKRQKVVVEASYEVGEYDIQILSAQESDGLIEYLTDNGYRIPDGASDVLGSYIKQKMRFFVAKVNLARMKLEGAGFIRPLQVRYESKKFMLPIRLGTVNASGPQDLIVYALTRRGRVEATNYRTVKIPSNMDVPLYVKAAFGDFYKALFERQVAREDMHAVFLEYAWNMGWCDPCAADPLSVAEMNQLGARWLDPSEPRRFGMAAFATRLHVRYDAAHFPEDLQLQETKDSTNFQGRYVLRHPWSGAASCTAGDAYWRGLPARFEKEAQTLTDLTGWQLADVKQTMETTGQSFVPKTEGLGPFLERLFR
ncbi:MAG: DUF2330 domain-containing protein [Proteobacteria bacterium]|nr:DUF2330 domain-containing protein [Pseudomonadota bacterium]